MLQVDDHDQKDRGDSGISRSTHSSSPPFRHASSKWAYRTINLHPGSETEGSERGSPIRKRRSPKLKKTPRKKSKELPVVRGIPRVIRRVKTETMLMAGRYCKVFLTHATIFFHFLMVTEVRCLNFHCSAFTGHKLIPLFRLSLHVTATIH